MAALAEQKEHSIGTKESEREGGAAPNGQPLLKLYNSMSRSKEVFTPREGQGNAVSMYVCGVTVYSVSHIGATSQACYWQLVDMSQFMPFPYPFPLSDLKLTESHRQEVALLVTSDGPLLSCLMRDLY